MNEHKHHLSQLFKSNTAEVAHRVKVLVISSMKAYLYIKLGLRYDESSMARKTTDITKLMNRRAAAKIDRTRRGAREYARCNSCTIMADRVVTQYGAGATQHGG